MADNIDAVFAQIGFGRWQLIQMSAAMLSYAALASGLIGSTLTNAPISHRCEVPDDIYESSGSYESECHYPYDTGITTFNDTGTVNISLISIQPTISYNASAINIDSNTSSVSCLEWDYDKSVFTSTISMEWGLFCEKAWLSSLYQMVFSAGSMIGDVVGGAIGDKLGRRATVRYGALVLLASVLGIGLAPFYSIVLICRLMMGLTTSSIIYPTYNLVMEITPTSHRTVIGMILGAPYSIGVMCFAGLGYFLRDWRTLHFASSIFTFLLLTVSWVVDESPRWLAQNGYLDEAKEVLRKAAAYNGSPLPSSSKLDQILFKLANEGKAYFKNKKSCTSTLELVFSNLPMAVITVVTPLTWFLMAVVYLGIPLNVSNFGGNPFIYVALTGLMEFLPAIVGIVFSKRLNRVPVMTATFFASGLCSLLVLAVTKDLWWLRWILIMAAMELISTSYTMSYVWAPELYPTVIRSRGCSSCALGGHLGFFVTPFITDFVAQQVWWLPNMILGMCAVLGGMLVCLLPETKGLDLCETVQDVKERSKASRLNRAAELYQVDVQSNLSSS
ncbi:solute carrier family 22 member 20-like [Palaemon carinicauda]|uniref:solute carrier family 22 member 20-like n=1 Tax=Palaemon carinicauda TaxID=392227 RepID=UPI0035B57E38